MKKFPKSHHTGDKLKVFIVSLLAITFLAVPVLAAEMTPAEQLAKAANLSTQASEMAIRAQETGDPALAQEALALANEAAGLIAGVASYATETGSAQLAQAAMDAAVNLMTAINQIIDTAQYLAQTGTDPGIINIANDILAKANGLKNLNNNTMTVAIASGATPPPAGTYTPPSPPNLNIPVDPPPPIQDTVAASPT